MTRPEVAAAVVRVVQVPRLAGRDGLTASAHVTAPLSTSGAHRARSASSEEVATEVRQVRDALGTHADIVAFVDEALRALGASVTPTEDGFAAVTSTLTVGVRDALPAGYAEPLPFHRQPPAPRRHAALIRTDPHVEAIARHVLDTALDTVTGTTRGPARRAGVMRTAAVLTRTTLLLVRFRFHLLLPTASGPRPLVAEDAKLIAFTGPPDSPQWLDEGTATALLTAQPGANVPADQARALAERVIAGLTTLDGHLGNEADQLAAELLDTHRRVRAGAGAARRGLDVRAQKPADILGVYVYLPVLPCAGATA